MGTAEFHRYNVYGFRFTINGDNQAAVEGLGHDFAFFRTPGAAEGFTESYSIEMIDACPDYDGLPVARATIYTPRNTVYKDGDVSYLDYRGRGLGIHIPRRRLFRIISRDPDLLYEAGYLFLLSQIGKYLDSRGIHRVHALGAAIDGRAILVLLPMGGGKSTLGAYLLRHPEVKLLSDDSPFIDARRGILAFPLHLGLLSGLDAEVPAEHRRLVRRMEFGPKYLINYEHFAGKVCPEAEPGLVFLGRRTLSRECTIEAAGMGAGLRAMIANTVVGLGLFHGLEFILERSAWELISQARVGWSRLAASYRLLSRSKVAFLNLGRDPEANAAAVVEYARRAFR